MQEQIHSIPRSELWKNLAAGAAAGLMLGAAFGIGFDSLPLGLPVGLLFGTAVGYRISRAPIRMQFPLFRLRRILLAGALFILASLGFLFLREGGWTGSRLVLAGLAAGVAWAVLVAAIGSAIASLDEMQRRIQTEAIALGFAGAAILAGGYGLLGFAGVAQLNWGLLPLVMVVMWLLGKLWTMWRYR